MSLESLPFGLPFAGETGIEAEETDFFLRRCRLVFALGAVVAPILILVGRLLIDGEPDQIRLLGRWETLADGLHVLSFLLALGSLHIGEPGAARLQRTAFAVLAFNLVLSILNGGLLEPDYPPALLASLMLFIPAAVIPWRLRYQVALAVVAVLTPLLAQVAGFHLHPRADVYWGARGGEGAFWEQTLGTTIGVTVMAVLSVIVTRTLYDLRRSARRAERMGNYTILKKLGSGGMAEVYLAHHARMVRPSAVKVLRLPKEASRETLARFEREIRLASRLTHPHTIAIFDFGRADRETFYYAMEYLEGIDLEAFVRRFGPLPATRTVFVLRQVCGSLAEAHGRGIVHRDLKPSNIFLTTRGGLHDFVKVLDFGLAKQLPVAFDAEGSREPDLTGTGQVFGTPTYMSPEQWDDTADVDARADIYSLGGVAYHLLTGRPPFTARSMVRLLTEHARTAPDPPSRVCELDVPSELDAIVLKCLEKRPEDRFPTVEDLERALSAVRFSEPWTRRDARAWWKLHGPTLDSPSDSTPRARNGE